MRALFSEFLPLPSVAVYGINRIPSRCNKISIFNNKVRTGNKKIALLLPTQSSRNWEKEIYRPMIKRLSRMTRDRKNRRMLIRVCYSEWSIIPIHHHELNMLSAAASLLYKFKVRASVVLLYFLVGASGVLFTISLVSSFLIFQRKQRSFH